jgi:hypothetical protein
MVAAPAAARGRRRRWAVGASLAAAAAAALLAVLPSAAAQAAQATADGTAASLTAANATKSFPVPEINSGVSEDGWKEGEGQQAEVAAAGGRGGDAPSFTTTHTPSPPTQSFPPTQILLVGPPDYEWFGGSFGSRCAQVSCCLCVVGRRRALRGAVFLHPSHPSIPPPLSFPLSHHQKTKHTPNRWSTKPPP